MAVFSQRPRACLIVADAVWLLGTLASNISEFLRSHGLSCPTRTLTLVESLLEHSAGGDPANTVSVLFLVCGAGIDIHL